MRATYSSLSRPLLLPSPFPTALLLIPCVALGLCCILWHCISTHFPKQTNRTLTTFYVSRITYPSVLFSFLSIFFSSIFSIYLCSFLSLLLCFCLPHIFCVRFSFSLQFHLLATRDAKWPFRPFLPPPPVSPCATATATPTPTPTPPIFYGGVCVVMRLSVAVAAASQGRILIFLLRAA